MRTIHKYPIKMSADFDVVMPEAHKVIHIGRQGSGVDPDAGTFMWVEVDNETEVRPFAFAVVGTGHTIPGGMTEHVGTWIEHGGFFVWHLYENVQTRLDIPFEFSC